MKIKIDHVVIEIKDNWRHCLVAWLVDRDDFLKDIKKARTELGLAKGLIRYDDVREWLHKELEKERGETPDPLSGGNRYLFPKTKSEKITADLLKKYHRSPLYFETIRYVILAGKVTDTEFSRTAFCQVLPQDYQMINTDQGITNLVEHDQPVMAIIISPETKLKEVVGIFQKEVPYLRTEYIASYLKGKRIPPDIISKIKRDRRWYWLHRQGMSYNDIFKKEGKKLLTRDGVVKAIKRYQRKLKMNV